MRDAGSALRSTALICHSSTVLDRCNHWNGGGSYAKQGNLIALSITFLTHGASDIYSLCMFSGHI